jgi:hypothetical protein
VRYWWFLNNGYTANGEMCTAVERSAMRRIVLLTALVFSPICFILVQCLREYGFSERSIAMLAVAIPFAPCHLVAGIIAGRLWPDLMKIAEEKYLGHFGKGTAGR